MEHDHCPFRMEIILNAGSSAAARMLARSTPASNVGTRAVKMRPVVAHRQMTIKSTGTCRDLEQRSSPVIGIQRLYFTLIMVMFVPSALMSLLHPLTSGQPPSLRGRKASAA